MRKMIAVLSLIVGSTMLYRYGSNPDATKEVTSQKSLQEQQSSKPGKLKGEQQAEQQGWE